MQLEEVLILGWKNQQTLADAYDKRYLNIKCKEKSCNCSSKKNNHVHKISQKNCLPISTARSHFPPGKKPRSLFEEESSEKRKHSINALTAKDWPFCKGFSE